MFILVIIVSVECPLSKLKLKNFEIQYYKNSLTIFQIKKEQRLHLNMENIINDFTNI